ncbi:helix-turn-helix domain-containing protein [Myroides sp. LJL119]
MKNEIALRQVSVDDRLMHVVSLIFYGFLSVALFVGFYLGNIIFNDIWNNTLFTAIMLIVLVLAYSNPDNSKRLKLEISFVIILGGFLLGLLFLYNTYWLVFEFINVFTVLYFLVYSHYFKNKMFIYREWFYCISVLNFCIILNLVLFNSYLLTYLDLWGRSALINNIINHFQVGLQGGVIIIIFGTFLMFQKKISGRLWLRVRSRFKKIYSFFKPFNPVDIPSDQPQGSTESPKPQETRRKKNSQQEVYNSLRHQISKEIIDNKAFLNPDLSLDGFAQHVGYPATIVRRYIRQSSSVTFKNYINRLKVEYAIELIKDNKNKISIEDLSIMAGFNNRISFYRAFVTVYGFAPSEIT